MDHITPEHKALWDYLVASGYKPRLAPLSISSRYIMLKPGALFPDPSYLWENSLPMSTFEYLVLQHHYSDTHVQKLAKAARDAYMMVTQATKE